MRDVTSQSVSLGDMSSQNVMGLITRAQQITGKGREVSSVLATVTSLLFSCLSKNLDRQKQLEIWIFSS